MACSDSRRFLLLAATTATDDLPVDLWQDQHIWNRMGWRWSEAMVVEIIKGKWKSHSVAIVIEFYSAIFSLYSVSLCYFGIFHPKLFIYLSARSLHSLPVLGRIICRRTRFLLRSWPLSQFQWKALHATDYYHLNVGFSFTVFHFNHPLYSVPSRRSKTGDELYQNPFRTFVTISYLSVIFTRPLSKRMEVLESCLIPFPVHFPGEFYGAHDNYNSFI